MAIKKFRESRKMTQQDLAAYLGVSRSSVAAWETGLAYPRVEILIKLSELFGCTIDELVKGEKENETSDP